GKLIFPALAKFDNSSLSKDTNAQESLGNDFKRTAPGRGQRKITLWEAVEHTYCYMKLIEKDYNSELSGCKTRTGDPTKKKGAARRKKYFNDGRAPDTTKTLISKRKSRRSKGYASNPLNDINWGTFGIPWSFEYEGLKANNTCSLDTPLMAWYLLQKFKGATLPQEVLQTHAGKVLQDIMTAISEEEYHKARWLWCTEVLHLDRDSTRVRNLWNSIEGSFTEHLQELVCLS
ncbi:hypothetical protein BGZ49_006043, partial [Haplosporangium sp. Z 27]